MVKHDFLVFVSTMIVFYPGLWCRKTEAKWKSAGHSEHWDEVYSQCNCKISDQQLYLGIFQTKKQD